MTKKIVSFVVLFALVCIKTSTSQVSAYVFSQFTGTYIPLTVSGGTTVATGFQDDNVYGNIPIGFPFMYNNTTYTAVGLSTNGWMSFGGNVPNDNFAPISNSGGNAVSYMCGDMQLGPYQNCTTTIGSNVIAFTNTLASQFFIPGDVLTGTGIPASTSVVAIGAGNMTISANATANGTAVTTAGRISYAVSGVAPNRVFTLQFRQVGRWNNDGTGQNDYVNAQIKLYETSNVVEIVYGHSGTFNSNVLFSETGIVGQTSADFNIREVPTGNNWLTSTQGMTNGAKCVMSNSNTIPFGLTYRWTPPTPCTGTPPANGPVASQTLACSNGNAYLNLAQTYTLSGLSFVWSASSNAVGPYTPISTYTNAAFTASNISADTWFICTITCTNSSQTFTTVPIKITSVATITNSVPYFEGFETVPFSNVLPNCSWSSSTPSIICQTYTTANTYNRIPKSGTKFASFKYGTSLTGDYFYTNAIWLYSGYTYSAAVNYVTDGAPGWSEFSMLIGQSQSTLGLLPIASVAGTITNTTYSVLANTFTVPTSGYYHIAIKAVGSSNPWYLSWDDLSVTAPCNLNTPTLAVSGGTASYCAGAQVQLIASGANSFNWNSGTSDNSATNVVSAIQNFSYLVSGANLVNCNAILSKTLDVLPLPVLVFTPSTQTICVNASASVSVSGGNTYTWNPSNFTGATFTLNPPSSIVYTVVSTGTNNCVNSGTVAIAVDPCTGIKEDVFAGNYFIYPNPVTDKLIIESQISENSDWILTDLTGRILLDGKTQGYKTTLDLDKLNKGIYMLELSNKNMRIARKIVKD